MIANDGNFLVNPITLTQLDHMGSGERYDIVVDFSAFRVGDKLKLVNVLEMQDGRRPEGTVNFTTALNRRSEDPAVGPILEFRVVDQVESVDVPGVFHHATDPDPSQVPLILTEQIPVVQPVRTRVIEWVRGGDNPRDASGAAGLPPGQCIPDCGDRESFPWAVRVNGEAAHSLNANRVSNLIPRPGEVEHWTFVNGGGGWDHPIHLHFEEGVTINRGEDNLPITERLVRKDVWRLREGGEVKFQVRFGEFGGAYVSHCHNTVHEDNSMLMRYDILTEDDGRPQVHVIPTPHPTPDGVTYLTPEILPEGDPNNPQFFRNQSAQNGSDDGRG
jgi:FtsP/CotA-like multicopper oxidase with cupredoxin domain